MFEWSTYDWIFSYCINWLSIFITDYFLIYLIPTNIPVLLWIAGKNLPNLPNPLTLPSLKSSKDSFWKLIEDDILDIVEA